MREPSFWRRPAPGLAARLLAPCAAIYGAFAAARQRRPGRRAGVPVLCVGNLTAGGGGKTPTALALARLLTAAGRRPVFLTRGYGGAFAGPVRVEAGHRAAEVGDEPLLLARGAPTIVARDRAAGARAAVAAGADVIVMDDGFQNPGLVKDFALIAVDGRRGVGNGCVIPAGPLRAPLAAQFDHVHAILAIGDIGESAQRVVAAAERRGLPVFAGRLEPDPAAAAALAGRRVLGYAGIADPDKFFASLAAAGASVAAQVRFPDHHPYAPADAARLLARADRDGLDLVTTEKDAARFAGDPALAALAARSRVFPVVLSINDAGKMCALICARAGLSR